MLNLFGEPREKSNLNIAFTRNYKVYSMKKCWLLPSLINVVFFEFELTCDSFMCVILVSKYTINYIFLSIYT
jgi:hypothetical protein